MEVGMQNLSLQHNLKFRIWVSKGQSNRHEAVRLFTFNFTKAQTKSKNLSDADFPR